MTDRDTVAAAKPVRCAIYTRKSTDDGLEQEFNSLDAQYEACASSVASQRHEAWTLVKDRYDGFSGGTMDRPGLKRLLADVAAGKVQVIVHYKIDRLTRSLSDFSGTVEVLEQAGASFVSVTQSFNTTTSMGRPVPQAPAWRLPAHAIEKAVVSVLTNFLSDQLSVRRLVGTADAGQLAVTVSRCQGAAEQLKTSAFHPRIKVPALLERVDVADATMTILLSHAGLTDFLGVALEPQQLQPLVSPISRVRKGQEVKLTLSNEDAAERDQTFVSLLREAMSARRESAFCT